MSKKSPPTDPLSGIDAAERRILDEKREDSDLFLSVARRKAAGIHVDDREVEDALRFNNKTAEDLKKKINQLIQDRKDLDEAGKTQERERALSEAAAAEVRNIEKDREEERELKEAQKARRTALWRRKADCEAALRVSTEATERLRVHPGNSQRLARRSELERERAGLHHELAKLGNTDDLIAIDLAEHLRSFTQQDAKEKMTEVVGRIVAAPDPVPDEQILEICNAELSAVLIRRSQPLISRKTGQVLERAGIGPLHPSEFLDVVSDVRDRREERNRRRERIAAIEREIQKLDAEMVSGNHLLN